MNTSIYDNFSNIKDIIVNKTINFSTEAKDEYTEEEFNKYLKLLLQSLVESKVELESMFIFLAILDLTSKTNFKDRQHLYSIIMVWNQYKIYQRDINLHVIAGYFNVDHRKYFENITKLKDNLEVYTQPKINWVIDKPIEGLVRVKSSDEDNIEDHLFG